MATRTIANGGGNWSTAGTWVEGVAPTSADAVVATATSGNVTIDTVSCACLTMILTNYVGTMTFGTGNTLTVTSTVTFVSGMNIAGSGTLALGSTSATITSAGKTIPNLKLAGGTKTLGDNWTILGNLTGTSTTTLNSNIMYVGGDVNFSASTSARLLGTTNIVMNGTGTISTYIGETSSSSYITNNLTINTTGTITVGTYFRYLTGTLTYTSGTVVTTNSNFAIGGTCTINTSGITWNNIYCYNTAIITLSSDLTCSGILKFGVINIAGAYSITISGGNFSCGTMIVYPGQGSTLTIEAGKTITINSYLKIIGDRDTHNIAFSSSVSTTHFHLNYAGTLANCLCFGTMFTDCDASGSTVPIFNWCGDTLIRTTNIYNVDGSNYPAVADVKNAVSYANGAYTGTYAGGGVSNDVFGVM